MSRTLSNPNAAASDDRATLAAFVKSYERVESELHNILYRQRLRDGTAGGEDFRRTMEAINELRCALEEEDWKGRNGQAAREVDPVEAAQRWEDTVTALSLHAWIESNAERAWNAKRMLKRAWLENQSASLRATRDRKLRASGVTEEGVLADHHRQIINKYQLALREVAFCKGELPRVEKHVEECNGDLDHRDRRRAYAREMLWRLQAAEREVERLRPEAEAAEKALGGRKPPKLAKKRGAA